MPHKRAMSGISEQNRLDCQPCNLPECYDRRLVLNSLHKKRQFDHKVDTNILTERPSLRWCPGSSNCHLSYQLDTLSSTVRRQPLRTRSQLDSQSLQLHARQVDLPGSM